MAYNKGHEWKDLGIAQMLLFTPSSSNVNEEGVDRWGEEEALLSDVEKSQGQHDEVTICVTTEEVIKK